MPGRNEEATAHVVQPGENEEPLLEQSELKETILAPPAIADGALYVRSDKYLWKVAKPGQMPYTYDHPRPAVTVDVVVVSRDEPPRVLLIRRKHNPFAGQWALPGGFIEMDETLEASARRELREETGLAVDQLEQLHTFGEPGRDPRGRTIAVAYLARVDADRVQPRADDDAAAVGWHRLDQLPELAFDHDQIVAHARRRLGLT